jgi:hypothetical protein
LNVPLSAIMLVVRSHDSRAWDVPLSAIMLSAQ